MSVLVVVATAEEAAPLVRWGLRFARARDAPLTVLHVGRAAKEQESTELPWEDPEDAHPVRKAIREAASAAVETLGPPPASESRRLRRVEAEGEGEPRPPEGAPVLRQALHPDALQAVLREVGQRSTSLLVVGRHEHVRGESGIDFSEQVLDEAPCDVILLRAGPNSGKSCERVLIPAAGGPHSPVALKLGEGLTRDGAEVHPLYVEPETGELAEEVGRSQLNKVLAAARVDPRNPLVKARVVVADNPMGGIGQAAKEGYDLVLIGASEKNFVQRVLFRTLPERLILGLQPPPRPDESDAGQAGTAVAIMRRGTGLRDRAFAALRNLRERFLPQLEREERIALFARLQEGSRFDVDFCALISLATAIASLGLIQNSPAVVIGAMLVAPLMTPMVGAGLALVQGNVVLVRVAAKSILLGFCTALLIGVALGALCRPLLEGGLTSELLARGGPTLLDLLVAFLSGLAAAYAIARPNLSGALPGVAIAAALVPPIGTVGISLATGVWENAEGAALLFGTNLVAIVLGAAFTFWAIGVHGDRERGKKRLWVRRMLQLLVLALVCLTVPLVNRLVRVLAQVSDPPLVVTPALRDELERRVERPPGVHFVTAQVSHNGADLEVLIASQGPPESKLADALAQVASRRVGRKVRVHLVVVRSHHSLSSE